MSNVNDQNNAAAQAAAEEELMATIQEAAMQAIGDIEKSLKKEIRKAKIKHYAKLTGMGLLGAGIGAGITYGLMKRLGQ